MCKPGRLPAAQTQSITLLAIFSVSALITCVSPLVFAQDSERETPITINITESLVPKGLDYAPINRITITEKQLESERPKTVLDVLANIPGVYAVQGGGRGGGSAMYLRGGDPNLTVVRVDGIVMNNPNDTRGGTFDLSSIDGEHIQRVDVTRGPLSGLDGSGAITGVIDIYTKRPTTDNRFIGDVSIGTRRYERIGALASGPIGSEKKNFYSLTTSYVDEGEQTEGDSFRGKELGFSFFAQPANRTLIRINSRHADHDSTSFPLDSGGPQFATIREVDKKRNTETNLTFDLSLDGSSNTQYSYKASWRSIEQNAYSPGVSPGFRDPFGIPENQNEDDFERTNLSAEMTKQYTDKISTNVSAEFNTEKGVARGILFLPGLEVPTRFDLTRTTLGLKGGLQYRKWRNWVFESAIRVDRPDKFPTEVTPLLGIVYKNAPRSRTVKFNWGQGFKLPSFFALGNPIVGNPLLNTEKSSGIDIGIEQVINGKNTIQFNWYKTQFRGLIDFEEGPPPRLVNRSNVDATGFEFVVASNYREKFRVNYYISYTSTNIRGTSEELRNRPQWHGGLKVNWKPKPKVAINFDISYVDERLDSSIPTGDQILASYWLMDALVTWKVQENFGLSIDASNFIDTEYDAAIGFVAPGARIRLLARFGRM